MLFNLFVKYVEDPDSRCLEAMKNEDNDSESKERAGGLYFELGCRDGGGAVV